MGYIKRLKLPRISALYQPFAAALGVRRRRCIAHWTITFALYPKYVTMQINQGRTYGGGNGPAPPTEPKSDRIARERAAGGSEPAVGMGEQSSSADLRKSYLSQADMSRRARDPRNAGSTDANGPARSFASNGLPARPVHSEGLIHKYVDGESKSATSAPASVSTGPVSAAPVNNADRPVQNAGQVRGILKTTTDHTRNTSADLNTSLGKSSNKAAGAAIANPLAGQTVFVHGLKQPIKPLPKTLEALRAGKPWSEAFQSKEASYLYRKSGDSDPHSRGLVDESASVNNISQLSVYFPLSSKKELPHNPADCGKLCNGAPHVDRAPTCRFCLARIAPKYKEKVSNFDLDLTLVSTRPGTDGFKQLVFNARECLDHLQTCKGIPNEDDRKLLYDAFRKADERFIENYHTSEWRTGVSLHHEATHAKPLLPPKPRSQQQATSVPMGRRTSSGSHAAPPRQISNSETRQTVPIAAKQLPNKPPSMPLAPRSSSSATNAKLSDSTLGHRPSASTSSLPSQSHEGGWGISTESTTYDQHVAADTISEKDELEEHQHDPEDNFKWQAVTAVKQMLSIAPPSDGQATYNELAHDGDAAQFFGAEIIGEPRSAPQGGSFIPSRHISVPPSRLPSGAAYRGGNGEAMSRSNSNETHSDQGISSTAQGAQSAAMEQSITTSSTSTQAHQQSHAELFRAASPPNSRQAKTEAATPKLSQSRRRDPSPEMQDMPEPELPAEDPWDLVPEPEFEQFFEPRNVVRSSAPPLDSRSTATRASKHAKDAVGKSQSRKEHGKGANRTQEASADATSVLADPSGKPASQSPNKKNIDTQGAAAMPEPEAMELKQKRKEEKKLEKKRRRREEREQREAEQQSQDLVELERERQELAKEKEQHQETHRKKGKDKSKKKGKDKAQVAEEVMTRERSLSVECLNPIKPVSSRTATQSHSQATDVVPDSTASVQAANARDLGSSDDEDSNLPIRRLSSGQVSSPTPAFTSVEHFANGGFDTMQKKPSRDSNVVEISSSSEDEVALQPKAKQTKSKCPPKVKASLGPVAKKTMKSDRKGKYRSRDSSHELSDNDIPSSDDSDSDCPVVTSRRVESNGPARPLSEVTSKPTSRGKPSTVSSAGKVGTQNTKKRPRAPTPSDPSESEQSSDEDNEEQVIRLTEKQIAANAKKFQRFMGRDASPKPRSKKASKEKKKKRKLHIESDREGSHSQPARVVRRQVDVVVDSPASSNLNKDRKRKAKAIQVSEDEEDEEETSQNRRLKTYKERQAQIAKHGSTHGSPSSHVGSSNHSRHSSIQRYNDIHTGGTPPLKYFGPDSNTFFVDVQKNVDNVLSLPPELEPWGDIFEAADILNLDTLQDCIRKPENADEFVKWVLAVSFDSGTVGK